jgi:predicted acyl esterase
MRNDRVAPDRRTSGCWRASGPPSNQSDRHLVNTENTDARTVDAEFGLIEYDVSIPAGDGLVLRADVFRPHGDGRYPVLLSYGPYGKGLLFSEGYADQWEMLTRDHPEVTRGSSGKYQNWEVADPERWVPDGYVCVRVDSRGAGRTPGYLDCSSPQEARDLYDCIEWERRAQRYLLLRDQPVAGRDAPAAKPQGDLSVGGCRGLLP